MPPIDWAQVIIAVVSALVTYFFSRRTGVPTPVTPALPALDPVSSHPVIQGILRTLAGLATQTAAVAGPALAPTLANIMSQPMTIDIDGHKFTIDASGLRVNTAPAVPLPSLVPSKN